MILALVSFFVFGVSAAETTGGIFAAHSTAEILALHKQEQQISVSKQRCEAELKGAFVPAHCFMWLKQSTVSPRRRQVLQKWFSAACEKSVKQNFSAARFYFDVLNVVSASCRQRLIRAAQDWVYQAQKEGNPDTLRFLETIGSDFESLSGDESVAAKRSNRYKTSRKLGRRLN